MRQLILDVLTLDAAPAALAVSLCRRARGGKPYNPKSQPELLLHRDDRQGRTTSPHSAMSDQRRGDGNGTRRPDSGGPGRGRGRTPGRPHSGAGRDPFPSSPRLLDSSPGMGRRIKSEGTPLRNQRYNSSSQRGKFAEFMENVDVKGGLQVKRIIAPICVVQLPVMERTCSCTHSSNDGARAERRASESSACSEVTPRVTGWHALQGYDAHQSAQAPPGVHHAHRRPR